MKIERRNAYFCKECRKATITVDVDKGITPAFILCPDCGKMASSFMYQLPGCMHFNVKAEYEWYKPDISKVSKGEADHVKNGGLLMRKRTDAKPEIIDLSKK